MAQALSPQSISRSSVSQSQFCHLAYFQSWPLIGDFGGDKKYAIERLDFEAEMKALISVLKASNRAIRLIRSVASSSNFITTLNRGAWAIHYTGHGLPNVLAFEDEKGLMHSLADNVLVDVLTAGGNDVRFAFVSACYSEATGLALVRAGVKHVIAVRADAQVADHAGQIFTKHFYERLLRGGTVQDAFNIGTAAVKADPATKRADMAKKFLLLPKNAPHDVSIFAEVPDGPYQDLTEPDMPNNLDPTVEQFRGRNFEMQKVVQLLHEHKRVTIIGEKGIGKSALANAVAQYVWKRRRYAGVFWINVGAYAAKSKADIPVKSVAALVLMQLNEANGGPEWDKAFSHLDETKVTNKKFAQALHALDEEYLFILDGVDGFLQYPAHSPLSITSFIETIRSSRVLVTCRSATTARAEKVVKLGPLDTTASAQLFYHLAPRSIPPEEYNCTSPERHVMDLAHHPALTMLGGNPLRIGWYVRYLNGHKMSELPAIIKQGMEQEEEEEKKEDLEERIRLKNLRINSELQNGHKKSVSLLPTTGPHPPVTTPGGSYASGDVLTRRRNSLEETQIEEYIRDARGRKFWRQFGGRTVVPWADVAKALNREFIARTGALERPLDEQDFSFMKAKVEEQRKDYITVRKFGSVLWPFMEAFERCVARHKYLWEFAQPVLILGVLSRAAAVQKLQGKAPGTFLLRFSLNQPGHIAVSYVDGNADIQHVLIKIESDAFSIDMGQKADQTKVRYDTLDELVEKCKPLQFLYPGVRKEEVLKVLNAGDDAPS